MNKVHLFKCDTTFFFSEAHTQCGILVDNDNVETIDPTKVTCGNCKKTEKYKSMLKLHNEVQKIGEDIMDSHHRDEERRNQENKSCHNCAYSENDKCYHKASNSVVVMNDGTRCSEWSELKVFPYKYDIERYNRDNTVPPQHGQHYKSDSMQMIDKFNMIISNLENEITHEQSALIFNFFKYFDRISKKDNDKDDAYKCADYIYRLINGEFLNEVEK